MNVCILLEPTLLPVMTTHHKYCCVVLGRMFTLYFMFVEERCTRRQAGQQHPSLKHGKKHFETI